MVGVGYSRTGLLGEVTDIVWLAVFVSDVNRDVVLGGRKVGLAVSCLAGGMHLRALRSEGFGREAHRREIHSLVAFAAYWLTFLCSAHPVHHAPSYT